MPEPHSAGQPKTYKERIHKDAELDQLVQAFKSRGFRFLARLRGIDLDEVDQNIELYGSLAADDERIASSLGPRGWILSDSTSVPEYASAADLVEQGRPTEADDLLVQFWGTNQVWKRMPLHRGLGLYLGADDDWIEIGQERQRLLEIALNLHETGHYAGAIPIVLAQMDGLFLDFTREPSKEFFDRSSPYHVDDITTA